MKDDELKSNELWEQRVRDRLANKAAPEPVDLAGGNHNLSDVEEILRKLDEDFVDKPQDAELAEDSTVPYIRPGYLDLIPAKLEAIEVDRQANKEPYYVSLREIDRKSYARAKEALGQTVRPYHARSADRIVGETNSERELRMKREHSRKMSDKNAETVRSYVHLDDLTSEEKAARTRSMAAERKRNERLRKKLASDTEENDTLEPAPIK